MTPAIRSFLRSGIFRRRSTNLSTYFLSHPSFPRTNYSSRSRNYSTSNHHQFPATGPLLMQPAANVGANGEIYDQLYDPLTGNYQIKERNKQLGDTAKIFASSRGWVCFVDPSRDCSLYLVNPTHDAHVQPIPLPTIESISCMLSVKRRLSSLSSSSSGLSVDTYYVLSDSCDLELEYSPEEVVSKLLNRVVLSSDPRDPGCKAMIVFGKGTAFCKLGIDYGWMHQDCFYNEDVIRAFHQPVYSTKDRMFYNLVHDRCSLFVHKNIQIWDASIDPPRKGRHKYDWKGHPGKKTYLVVDEYSGNLFLVYKLYPSSTSSSSSGSLCSKLFEIHRLVSGGKSRQMVTSIGDLAFFIGPYECFALSANEFPQIQPNSIYLVHNELEGEVHSSAAVVYNLQDHSVTPLACPYASCKVEQGAFWLAPSSLY